MSRGMDCRATSNGLAWQCVQSRSGIGNLESNRMRDLVQHLIKALEQDRELIVCQVVETRGSTPQKAGSMMIIDPDGGQVGTLGGGCVENEVKQKAIQQIGGESRRRPFVRPRPRLRLGGWPDLRRQDGDPHAAAAGTGPLAYFRDARPGDRGRRGFTEAIVVDAKQAGGAATGHAVLVRRRGPAAGELAGRAGARGTRRSGSFCPPRRPKPSVHGGIAFLPNWPRIRLVIVGAGHVGQAVASLAAQADFDVWVVDDRHQYANRERFPTAQRILVGPIEEVLRLARDHAPDLCLDRDARARPRPGSPLSAWPRPRRLTSA